MNSKRTITWSHILSAAVVLALIMPVLITFADESIGRTNIVPTVFPWQFLAGMYVIYSARVAVPYFIYIFSPETRGQGLLVSGFKASVLFEALLLFVAIAAIRTPFQDLHMWEAIGAILWLIGLLILSILAQILGMIYGYVRGFQR